MFRSGFSKAFRRAGGEGRWKARSIELGGTGEFGKALEICATGIRGKVGKNKELLRFERRFGEGVEKLLKSERSLWKRAGRPHRSWQELWRG